MKGANRAAMVLSLMLALTARAQEEPPPVDPPPPDTDGDKVIDAREFAGDTDGDNTLDPLDTDDDGDGVLTKFEVLILVDDEGVETVEFLDTDADTLPNHRDPDDDGDGIETADEDSDPNDDGDPRDARATSQAPDSSEYLADYLNADDDSDGVPTLEERPNGMDRDTDLDTVPDHLDDDDENDGIHREYTGNTDGDALPDCRDPDDDNDGVPTLEEGNPLRDTDADGKLDHVDADDDNDGIATVDELGSGASRRDTDGDLLPDFLEKDDDGDGLLTIDERALGDHDGDGILDYVDLDDDGDGINTVIERGYSEDPDGDGTPNWYDLDSDGDGRSDQEEGLGDDDGDGIPNFIDRAHGSDVDAGTPGGDAGADGGGAGGGGDAATIDGGTDGGGIIIPPSDDDEDSGCAIGRRDGGATSLWLTVLGLVGWLRRRRRAAMLAAGIALAGCDSDDDDDDGSVGLDGGIPNLDSGRRDAGASDATIPISDAQAGSECTVEGDVLAQSIYEPEERAFAAALLGDTVHVAYVARVCGSVESGNASGTSIDYLSFRSTGAFSAPARLAADPEGTCRMRHSPAIAPNGEGGVTFYFTANANLEYELYQQKVADGATPSRLTTDETPDEEVYTVAQQLGDGPLIAYNNRFSSTAPGVLVTARPGGSEREIVRYSQNQAPKRLALLAFPTGTGGAIGWVDASPSPGVRLRSIDAAGAPRSDAPVDLTTSVGAASAIAFAADATIAGVAYTIQNGSLGELRFRRLDSQGLPVGREIGLTSPNRSVTSISMAVYAKGFVIAFREVPVEIGLPASFRLMFIAENGAIAAERRLADATLSGAPTSQIFVAPDGRLIVLWTDAGAGDPVLHAMRVRCL